MDPKITFGVPKNQRVKVAKIIYEAFENKFKQVFGPNKSIPLMSKYLRNDRTVVAVNKGVVVGVAGLKFEGKEFIDIGFWQLLRELRFGIFRAMFLGWIFYDKVEKKELLVDTLAVAERMRGKGIGTSLINFTIDFARSKGFEQTKIFVVNTNQKAIRLYKRIGFKQVKTHQIPFPWNKIFGIEKASEMLYIVHQARRL